MIFNINDFKRVSLEDREQLSSNLLKANSQLCEFNYANLYLWGSLYSAKWNIFNDHLYIATSYKENPTIALTFSCNIEEHNAPSPQEIIEISKSLTKDGKPHLFNHIDENYINSYPILQNYFVVEQMSEDAIEYVHLVDSLVELSGKKLSKKRNLISQFKRAYPNNSIKLMTKEDLPAIIKLTEEWYREHASFNTEDLQQEIDVVKKMQDGFDEFSLEGVLGYVGDELVAFALCSRVSKTVYTEHFEKALPQYKGAAQYINQELAKFLQGKCIYLNREQDQGSIGLRKAKLSYTPEILLRFYTLKPKENVF